MRDVFVATYKVEIKLRRFWVTGSNRNQDLFPFYMPWRHHFWIDNCRYSYRNDLPENLHKNHCTTDILLSLWHLNKKQTAYCSLRNEMGRNEMEICSLRNENL